MYNISHTGLKMDQSGCLDRNQGTEEHKYFKEEVTCVRLQEKREIHRGVVHQCGVTTLHLSQSEWMIFKPKPVMSNQHVISSIFHVCLTAGFVVN